MKIFTQTHNYFDLAFGGGTPFKAFVTACFVGTIMTTINHGDQIYNGNYPHPLKIILTFCVPYFVTTWGAITGKLQKIIMNVQGFLNYDKIIELSFFNFENAITGAYFADENLKLIKVNSNFKKFFPSLKFVAGCRLTTILKELGLSPRAIKDFESTLEKKVKVYIPNLKININGSIRTFTLLSNKTINENFIYLNGVQGQFIDQTIENRVK